MKILGVMPIFYTFMGGAEVGIYKIFRRFTAHHNIKILTPHLDKNLIKEVMAGNDFTPKMTISFLFGTMRYVIAMIAWKKFIKKIIHPQNHLLRVFTSDFSPFTIGN